MNAIILTTTELIEHIKTYPWTRQITQLHVHHTYKPDHGDYNGRNGVELQNAMRDYHVKTNGWLDIAQHLTLLPDGRWVTGREFNADPASIQGWNSGAFCIEMLGNFDVGNDKFEGRQASAMFEFCAFFVLAKNLNIEKDVKFHRDSPTAHKTCPGTGISRDAFMQELTAIVEHLKSMQNDSWKYEGIDGLTAAGLINDPEKWKEKINDTVPVWAVMIILNRIYQKLSDRG